jgi:hypothetical protein
MLMLETTGRLLASEQPLSARRNKMSIVSSIKRHTINFLEYFVFFFKTYWSVLIFYLLVGFFFLSLNSIFPQLPPRLREFFSQVAEAFLLAVPIGSLASYIMDENITLISNCNELGLAGIYLHKRQSQTEWIMRDLLKQSTDVINKGSDSIVRLASVVGKQFIHRDGNLYSEVVSFLECLRGNEKHESSKLKVMLINPFSHLAFSRAESEEFKESSESLSPGKYIAATWGSLLFQDALISFSQLLQLQAKYPRNIDVRYVDYMPIFILTNQVQSVISPITFSASKMTSGNWYGRMPVYHYAEHLQFMSEAINHFDYLWIRGKSLEQLIDDLKTPIFMEGVPDDNRQAVLLLRSKFLEEIENDITT